MMVPLLCSFLADGRLSRRFLCPRGRRPHRTHGACAVHHPSVFSRRHRDLLRSRSSIVRSQRRAQPRSRRGGSPLARSLLVRSRSLPTTHSRPTVRRNARGQPERWTHGHLATRASRDCRLGPAHIAHAGVTGSMHGYFTIPLPPGTIQMSTSPNCDAVLNTLPCTTTTFIYTHFTACYPATCPVTTFFFHYSAGDQMLVVHEWKNASADRGGNHGDIQNVSVP